MAKFIFTTNSASATTYDGPSGTRYAIYGNKPFEVNDGRDIEFFRNNSRFSEVTIMSQIAQAVGLEEPLPKRKDQDELLEEELSKIKGLKEEVIKKVVELYTSREHLTDVVEQNYKLDPSIPRSQATLIQNHFLKSLDPNKVEPKIKKRR